MRVERRRRRGGGVQGSVAAAPSGRACFLTFWFFGLLFVYCQRSQMRHLSKKNETTNWFRSVSSNDSLAKRVMPVDSTRLR